MKKPRVALVHDYLQEFGGAERVVLALHRAFPEAPLYTGFYDPGGLGEHAASFNDVHIICTNLQKIPFHQQLRSPLRIATPAAFRALDLRDFDVVISSSNAYHAKSVQVRPGAIHLTYCHTPARSLYGYDTRSNWKKNRYSHFFGEMANHVLRLRDFEDAQAVTQVLVNSQTVARRVHHFWRRESTVVYPPVNFVDESVKNFKSYTKSDRNYYLYVNRLNFAKHPELAVQAAIDLDLPLKIVGTGPMEAGLAEMILRAGAAEHIWLLGGVSDTALTELYAGAKALLYPVADEDFGIVPVEAMAYGTPVIAHRSGGPMETILDGRSGVFFDKMTIGALEAAIRDFQAGQLEAAAIHRHAQQFSEARFIRQMQELVADYANKL